MESHAVQAGLEFRLTCVLNGVALLLVSSSLKKALSIRTVELAAENVGAPVMPIQEHDVVEAIPEERVSERIVEQITQSVPVYRIKDRIAEQIVDVPVPQMRREMVEVVQLVPVERIKDRIADQMVDIPVPVVME